MPTLLDFRRRIRSVKSSQQITRAMKFVAAARLRRAQEAALAARPYAQELARLLRSVMSRIQDVSNPLMVQREEKNILAIVMTGERGLAGAFNANILRKANEFFRANNAKKIITIPVGKKGRVMINRKPLDGHFTELARIFIHRRLVGVKIPGAAADQRQDDNKNN